MNIQLCNEALILSLKEQCINHIKNLDENKYDKLTLHAASN